MREIKFRGRRPNGQWMYGALIPAELSWWGVPSIADKTRRYEVDPETIGQFTGVYDSEEKPIFEGDVIRFPYRKREETGVVYYSSGMFRVKNNVYLREDDLFSVVFHKEIHVVGNIHDNPELMKGEKNELHTTDSQNAGRRDRGEI